MEVLKHYKYKSQRRLALFMLLYKIIMVDINKAERIKLY